MINTVTVMTTTTTTHIIMMYVISTEYINNNIIHGVLPDGPVVVVAVATIKRIVNCNILLLDFFVGYIYAYSHNTCNII